MNLTISICKNFSATPGPRLIEEGDYSGELFRDTCLIPAYLAAREASQKLLVDLDGCEGYATSFLEEAFGGLARQYPESDVAETLEFKSEDEPYLAGEIAGYIENARKPRQ